MLHTLILAVCALNLAFMAAWLTVGALENLIHPFLNEAFTAQVMDMERMRLHYPEAYGHVAYRRMANPRIRRVLFSLIVTFELIAAAALWFGVGTMAAAVLGFAETETAIVAGLIASALFSSVWAGFLVAGNYFCYWFGHEGGQNTHFHMLHWGLANCAILIAAAIYLR